MTRRYTTSSPHHHTKYASFILNQCHALYLFFFFFQAEDGIRDLTVTGVQTCALPIYRPIVLVLHADLRLAVRPEPFDRAESVQALPHRGEALDDAVRQHDGERHPLRSEEHTSELQSQSNLVCRLLLENKNERCLCVPH